MLLLRQIRSLQHPKPMITSGPIMKIILATATVTITKTPTTIIIKTRTTRTRTTKITRSEILKK